MFFGFALWRGVLPMGPPLLSLTSGLLFLWRVLCFGRSSFRWVVAPLYGGMLRRGGVFVWFLSFVVCGRLTVAGFTRPFFCFVLGVPPCLSPSGRLLLRGGLACFWAGGLSSLSYWHFITLSYVGCLVGLARLRSFGLILYSDSDSALPTENNYMAEGYVSGCLSGTLTSGVVCSFVPRLQAGRLRHALAECYGLR